MRPGEWRLHRGGASGARREAAAAGVLAEATGGVHSTSGGRPGPRGGGRGAGARQAWVPAGGPPAPHAARSTSGGPGVFSARGVWRRWSGGGCPLATLGRAIRPGPSPSMRANRACPPWRRPGKGYAIGSGRYGQGREKHGCRPWMRPGRGRCGWRGRHLRALRSHRRREAPSGRLRVAILKGRLMFRGMVCPVCADRVTRGVCAAAPRV